MTKERLRQYRSIKREIQGLRAEAKENEITNRKAKVLERKNLGDL